MFHTTKTNEEMLERQETWRNKEGFVRLFCCCCDVLLCEGQIRANRKMSRIRVNDMKFPKNNKFVNKK